MPRHTTAKRKVSKLSMGSSLSYQAPSGPLLPTESYKSANEWLRIAEEGSKIAKALGEAWITKQQKINEAAARAGTIAAIQGKSKDKLKHDGGLYTEGHREAAFDITFGTQKSAEFEPIRRKAAEEFGKDPTKRSGDWVIEEKRLRQKFIVENPGLNTQLSLMSFDNELTKNNTQHFNIFRHANMAALSRETVNSAYNAHKKSFSFIITNGGKVTRNPRHTEEGEVITDEEGNPVLGPPSVVVSQKDMEAFSSSGFLVGDKVIPGGRDAQVKQVGEDLVRYIEENNPSLDSEQLKELFTLLTGSAISQAEALYKHAEASEEVSQIEDAFKDLRFVLDVALEGMTKTTGKHKGRTSIWDASVQQTLQATTNKHELEFLSKKATLWSSIAGSINEHRLNWLPHLPELFQDKDSKVWTTDYNTILDIIREKGTTKTDSVGDPLLTPADLSRTTMINGLAVAIRDAILGRMDTEVKLTTRQEAEKARFSNRVFETMWDAIQEAETVDKLNSLSARLDEFGPAVKAETTTALRVEIANRRKKLLWFTESDAVQRSIKTMQQVVFLGLDVKTAIQEEEKARHNSYESRYYTELAKRHPGILGESFAAEGWEGARSAASFMGEDYVFPPYQKREPSEGAKLVYWKNHINGKKFTAAVEQAVNQHLMQLASQLTDDEARTHGFVDSNGKVINKDMATLNGGNASQRAWAASQHITNADLWPYMSGNEGYTGGTPDISHFYLSRSPVDPAGVDPEVPGEPATVPPKATIAGEKAIEGEKPEEPSSRLNTSGTNGFGNYLNNMEGIIAGFRKEAGIYEERAKQSTPGGRGDPARSWGDKEEFHDLLIPWSTGGVFAGFSDKWTPMKAMDDTRRGGPIINPTTGRNVDAAAQLHNLADTLEAVFLGPDSLSTLLNGQGNMLRMLLHWTEANMTGPDSLLSPDGTAKDPNDLASQYYEAIGGMLRAARGSYVLPIKNLGTSFAARNFALFGASNSSNDHGHPLPRTAKSSKDEVLSSWDKYIADRKDPTSVDHGNTFYRVERILIGEGYKGKALKDNMIAIYNTQLAFSEYEKFIVQPTAGYIRNTLGQVDDKADFDQRLGEVFPVQPNMEYPVKPRGIYGTIENIPKVKTKVLAGKISALQAERGHLPTETPSGIKSLADFFDRHLQMPYDRLPLLDGELPPSRLYLTANLPRGKGSFFTNMLLKDFETHHESMVKSSKYVNPLGIGQVLLTDKGTTQDLTEAIKAVPSHHRDIMFESPKDGTPLEDVRHQDLILLPLQERIDNHTEELNLYVEWLLTHGVNPLQFGVPTFRPQFGRRAIYHLNRPPEADLSRQAETIRRLLIEAGEGKSVLKSIQARE